MFSEPNKLSIPIGCLTREAHPLSLTGYFAVSMCDGTASNGGCVNQEPITRATGYGDVVLPSEWRMLGPIESILGVLMCGLSVNLLFAIATRLIGRQ